MNLDEATDVFQDATNRIAALLKQGIDITSLTVIYTPSAGAAEVLALGSTSDALDAAGEFVTTLEAVEEHTLVDTPTPIDEGALPAIAGGQAAPTDSDFSPLL
ncbi:hypothetical protein [Caldimonas sp. KR1-144]|uniref:hypothetical protein n=1 Tax=Caldimonas sp. KR1-144 TaxID=3400911 RepID=UPI003C0F4A81